jgi:hypothetical protein
MVALLYKKYHLNAIFRTFKAGVGLGCNLYAFMLAQSQKTVNLQPVISAV